MRNRLKYLNSLEHLNVSNSKETVRFYIFNYGIAQHCLRSFIPKDGLAIQKSEVDIKSELDTIIHRVESHFQLNYEEFLQLQECLNKFKPYNIKWDLSIEDDEIMVFFNKIKASEPDKLRNFGAYFHKQKDTLYQGYVNSDKFYLTPLWDNKNATIKDYINFFEKAFAKAVNLNPDSVIGF